MAVVMEPPKLASALCSPESQHECYRPVRRAPGPNESCRCQDPISLGMFKGQTDGSDELPVGARGEAPYEAANGILRVSEDVEIEQ